MSDVYRHQPVLAAEVSTFLAPRVGGIYLDATVGGGGHAAAIAARIAPGGVLVGIDRDLAAIEAAQERLRFPGVQVVLVHDNFANLAAVLAELGLAAVNGAVFDLGLSSPQVDWPARGFSYQHDAPLDMRMDQRQFLTARHLINEAPEDELARIIHQYGEERWARRIASFVIKQRRKAPLETTGQLVDAIKAAIPASARRRGGHPARKTFQALRIAVNDELNALRRALADSVKHLAPEGRLVVISFHSLEDRLVKGELLNWAKACRCPPEFRTCCCGGPQIRVLTRHPIVAGPREVADNPRARSAKLRAAVRLT